MRELKGTHIKADSSTETVTLLDVVITSTDKPYVIYVKTDGVPDYDKLEKFTNIERLAHEGG